ncbi:MAG: serine hydrolase [Tetrasphaera sp.]|nr:serine hydrolase [Tetrasphaera sp.]
MNLSLPAVHPLSPQARERGVTLDNWAEPPNVRWSFLHLEEILATQSIPASSDPEPLAAQLDPALLSVTTPRYDATGRIVRHTSVAEVLADTDTDGFALLHHGRIRLETYADSMTPDTRHLLMSVTKTVVGVIAATLVEEGWFGFDTLVEEVVPGLRDSGFGGATVRDLLDMRSGVRFSETYHDPDADVYLMEHATQWRSPREDVPSTLHDFLRSLPRDRPHGGTFHYRSSETDALAWVCEAATGTGLAQLIHDHVWQPMGGEHAAYITVDREGTAVADGGLCATLRDVVRFGEMLRHSGISPSGRKVGPSWFTIDTLLGTEDLRAAFAATSSPTGMPGGHYRNQVWVPFPDRTTFLALGIHGQMIYVNQRAAVTGVKLSSWPTAQDGARFYDTLALFETLAGALARSAFANHPAAIKEHR